MNLSITYNIKNIRCQYEDQSYINLKLEDAVKPNSTFSDNGCCNKVF